MSEEMIAVGGTFERDEQPWRLISLTPSPAGTIVVTKKVETDE